MANYIWEAEAWPNFQWDPEKINQLSIREAHESGLFNHRFRQLSTIEQKEYRIEMLALEAVSTSMIEGELIDRGYVKSWLKDEIRYNKEKPTYLDRVAAFILDGDRSRPPLEKNGLWYWQALVVRDPRIERRKWRTKPVQIMSGPIGRETVHYDAPPADRVPGEMVVFLDWFNRSNLPPPIKSGVAHLYFEMIHPFADGNGRVGRAIANIALGPQNGHTALSAAILSRRDDYYAALESFGKGDLDATEWLLWFIETLDEARRISDVWIDFTRSRLRIESQYPEMNRNQIRVTKRMLEAGPEGFKGGITASKYGKIAKCMTDVAEVDLSDLLDKCVLRPARKSDGFWARRYELNLK